MGYRFVVRTPRGVVLDTEVRSARVPTETGLVGLRPRGEPFISSIEAGLIVLHADGARPLAATAGGLIDVNRERAEVYTPLAVTGRDADEVLAELERAVRAPDGELAIRRQLAELEQRILREARERPRFERTGARHG